MEESMIPSLSTGVVGSRFVSSADVETAKARRDEQWKAAYARLGQEPPPQPVEDSYDGRSLAEKLAANKIAKQEEWEEKTKLANQYRALEEDEIMFLDSVRERQEEEERQRKQHDGEEVRSFKEAVAARTVSAPPIVPKPLISAPAKPKPSAIVKKDNKKALKGVLVKRKPKPSASVKPPTVSAAVPSAIISTEKEGKDTPEGDGDKVDGKRISSQGPTEDAAEPETKRRRLDS